MMPVLLPLPQPTTDPRTATRVGSASAANGEDAAPNSPDTGGSFAETMTSLDEAAARREEKPGDEPPARQKVPVEASGNGELPSVEPKPKARSSQSSATSEPIEALARRVATRVYGDDEAHARRAVAREADAASNRTREAEQGQAESEPLVPAGLMPAGVTPVHAPQFAQELSSPQASESAAPSRGNGEAAAAASMAPSRAERMQPPAFALDDDRTRAAEIRTPVQASIDRVAAETAVAPMLPVRTASAPPASSGEQRAPVALPHKATEEQVPATAPAPGLAPESRVPTSADAESRRHTRARVAASEQPAERARTPDMLVGQAASPDIVSDTAAPNAPFSATEQAGAAREHGGVPGPAPAAPAQNAPARAVRTVSFDVATPDSDPVRVRLRLRGDNLGLDLRAGPEHLRRLSTEDLRQSLERAGYAVDTIRLGPAAAEAPTASDHAGGGGAASDQQPRDQQQPSRSMDGGQRGATGSGAGDGADQGRQFAGQREEPRRPPAGSAPTARPGRTDAAGASVRRDVLV